jgi:nucleoid-associated protein YgaU
MKTKLLLCILAVIILAPIAQAQSADAAGDPHIAKAKELRTQAVAAYALGDYDTAAELARQAKAELGLVQEASANAALPATLTVRLIESDRDCLSKIAAFPFVYGDGESWVYLYKANKATLKHPENADLILPGEVLLIPSIAGERREGEFKEGVAYPNFSTER